MDHRGSELRRLERMLRPAARRDSGHAETIHVDSGPFEASLNAASHSIGAGAATFERYRAAKQPPAWGVSLLLIAGGTALVGGLLLLVAANMLLHPGAWRWGFAATLAGQGLLIGGLAAMATRLWRNSRRLNTQLDVLDRRLGEVQSAVRQTGPVRSSLRIDSGERPRLAFT